MRSAADMAAPSRRDDRASIARTAIGHPSARICALSFKWRAQAVHSVRGMSDTTHSEFWRDLKPIEEVFRPGAGADVYIADAPTDDDRYYVPFTETVSSRPLWISPSQNRWCDVLYAKGPGLVNRHYHPHQVF